MDRWKAMLKRLLFPGRGWTALIVLAGGGALALTFLVVGEDTPFAYGAYALSAYALTVFVAALAPLFSSAGRLVHRVPLAHRYMTDLYFKVRSSLLLSFFINFCYAGFKLTAAALYASFWDGALAVYYILLCAVRLYLLRRVPKEGQRQDTGRELQYSRMTGIFLILLDLALSCIATKIVQEEYGSSYPGMLIYVAALYAFYSLTMAVVNMVKFRKLQSPVLSVAKVVNLTTALVSIFNLETAMLNQFGQGDEHFRLVMTACTAFVVCVIVLSTAVLMVVTSTRYIRRLPK